MIDRTIVAIGGGEMGRIKTLPDGSTVKTDIETTLIDQFIVKATGKKHPKMLFIGTASGDDPVYLDMVKEHFINRIGCACVEPLNLIKEAPSFDEMKEKIFSNDIIYVGGGDTTMMLKVWKRTGVDKLLFEAYQKGIVLSGISAGAICWFDYYDNMDDIDDIKQLDIVRGLSFLKGFAVPHYDELTKNERDKINQKLTEKGIKGRTIDNCVALIFQNGKMSILSCRPDRTSIQIP